MFEYFRLWQAAWDWAQPRSKRVWHWIQDACAVWVQPLSAFIVVLTGPFLTQDFANLRKHNPGWLGPIDWIETYLFPIFLLAAVVSLASAIIVHFRNGTLRRLKGKLDAQRGQIEEISNVIIIVCDGLLLNLANKLNLAQESQVRLSLYVHDSVRRAFIPCGRYSRNPIYIKPGRTSYPDTQGCIREGWHNGWHFDNAFPPTTQLASRKAYNLKHYGIPDYVTDSISMKSCLYAVKRLETLEGKGIAVLVVEAMDPADFDEYALRDIIDASAVDYARVIHELRAYVPNPAKAAESGL